MFGKILIAFDMKVLTGLHIGGSNAFSAIGAVDSPVVRDAYSGIPMVPGSSLKGKLRYLLAKASTNHYIPPSIDREPAALSRLFGVPGNERSGIAPKGSRLQFSDCFLRNAREMREGSGYTEVKFENTINRKTAVANPRQIERVIRNGVFAVRIVYDIEEADQVTEDFECIARGLKLLSMDYLGGHGSRGYGKVGFDNFSVRLLDGDAQVDAARLEDLLKDVTRYAVFDV